MKRPKNCKWLITVSLVLLGLCCALSWTDSTADDGWAHPLPYEEAPEIIARRVDEFLAFNQGTEEFDGKRPHAIFPIHAHGIEGVAYYEVWLTMDGERTKGWILLSVTDNDHPLVSFSHGGIPPSHHLLDAAAECGVDNPEGSKIFRFGTSYLTLEDERGALLAEYGTMPAWVPGAIPMGYSERVDPETDLITIEGEDTEPVEGVHYYMVESYDALKGLFPPSYFTPERAEGAFEMRQEIFPDEGHGMAYLCATGIEPGYGYCYIDHIDNLCYYGQIPPNTGLNTTNCRSGCSNTALTRLYAWWDLNEGKTRLIPTTAYGEGCARNRKTEERKYAVDTVQMWLHSETATNCFQPFSKGGVVYPWKFKKGINYTTYRGYDRYYWTSWYLLPGYSATVADIPITYICKYRIPAVVANNIHYWVVTGIKQLTADSKYTYVYGHPGAKTEHDDQSWTYWKDLHCATGIGVTKDLLPPPTPNPIAIGSNAMPTPDERGPWPMFGYDPRNTFRSPYTGHTGPDLKWSYMLDTKPEWAVVGKEGHVYLPLGGNGLYCLSSDGSLFWSYNKLGAASYSPAIGYTGSIYYRAYDPTTGGSSYLYSLNSTGSLDWKQLVKDPGAHITLGPWGKAYSSGKETIHNFDITTSSLTWSYKANDSLQWSYSASNSLMDSVAIGDGNSLIVSTYEEYGGDSTNFLYSINSDGTLGWKYITVSSSTSGSYGVEPVIGPTGGIYTTTWDGLVHCLTPDGSLSWTYSVGGYDDLRYLSAPAHGGDDLLVTTWGALVMSMSQYDGSLSWSYAAGNDEQYSYPCRDADGKVYITGGSTNTFFCLSSMGSLSWSYDMGDFGYLSPVIGADGTVYTGGSNPHDSFGGIVLAIGPTPLPTPDPRGPWPMFHRDERNSGQSISRGLARGSYTIGSSKGKTYVSFDPDRPELEWSFVTGGNVRSSPAVDHDGCVYVGSDDNRVYSLDQAGALLWSHVTGGTVESSPAVETDGRVYVGSSDRRVYGLNSNGTLMWSYITGGEVVSSPFTYKEGSRVYVGSSDNYAYCINSDGSLLWKNSSDDKIVSSPAMTIIIGEGNEVCVGSHDKTFRWLEEHTGGEFSDFGVGDEIHSSPAVGEDYSVSLGSLDKRLYSLDSQGSCSWSYLTGGAIYSSPAVRNDGTVFVGAADQGLYSINSTGSLWWKYTAGGQISSSPALDFAGRVFVGSDDDRLYGLSSNGKLTWSYVTGGDVRSSPAIGAAGTIYVGSNDNILYAIRGKLSWVHHPNKLFFKPPETRWNIPERGLILPPYEQLVGLRSQLMDEFARSTIPEEQEQLQFRIAIIEHTIQASLAEDAGDGDLAGELCRQVEIMLLEDHLAGIEAELAHSEDDFETMRLELERDIAQLYLEIIHAGAAGNHDLADSMREQVGPLEAQLDAMTE